MSQFKVNNKTTHGEKNSAKSVRGSKKKSLNPEEEEGQDGGGQSKVETEVEDRSGNVVLLINVESRQGSKKVRNKDGSQENDPEVKPDRTIFCFNLLSSWVAIQIVSFISIFLHLMDSVFFIILTALVTSENFSDIDLGHREKTLIASRESPNIIYIGHKYPPKIQAFVTIKLLATAGLLFCDILVILRSFDEGPKGRWMVYLWLFGTALVWLLNLLACVFILPRIPLAFYIIYLVVSAWFLAIIIEYLCRGEKRRSKAQVHPETNVTVSIKRGEEEEAEDGAGVTASGHSRAGRGAPIKGWNSTYEGGFSGKDTPPYPQSHHSIPDEESQSQSDEQVDVILPENAKEEST